MLLDPRVILLMHLGVPPVCVVQIAIAFFIVDFVMCDWMYSQSPSPGAPYLDTMLRLCFFSQIIFSAFLSCSL